MQDTARKQWEPIILKAYVKTRDGIEVDVDTLTPEQKRKFATHMKITYLKTLCSGGQAVFCRAGHRGHDRDGHPERPPWRAGRRTARRAWAMMQYARELQEIWGQRPDGRRPE